MNKQNWEVEVKIHVADLQAIAQRLEKLGAKLTHERVYERNVRYDDEFGRLTESHIVLRLRSDTKVRLTYKAPAVIEQGISSREEIEVTLDDFANMEMILGKLGYQPALIYEKYRTTYEYTDAEIMLDELPYGNFIEVEAQSIDVIEQVLSALDLQGLERRENSYARLFDYVKHHRGLEFRDLTFDNFADLTIEADDFIPPGSIIIS